MEIGLSAMYDIIVRSTQCHCLAQLNGIIGADFPYLKYLCSKAHQSRMAEEADDGIAD
jgi:hypothetical protein